MDAGVYCGKCGNKYSKVQNFDEHFDKEEVKAVTGGKGSGYIPNICFNTSDPREHGKTLKEAKFKYKEKLQLRASAKKFFSVPKPTTAAATSTSMSINDPPSTKAASSKTASHSKPEIDSSASKKPRLSEDSSMELTLQKLLILTKEIHQNVVCDDVDRAVKKSNKTPEHKFSTSNNTNSTVSDDELKAQLKLISIARSISEILNNTLIKTIFKLVHDDSELEEQTEQSNETIIPNHILENVANANIIMPESDIDVGDLGETANSDSDDDHDNTEAGNNHAHGATLICLSCEHTGTGATVRSNRGNFHIKDITYEQGKENLPRWFINFNGNLLRHLKTLQHHQRVAVYQVLHTNSKQCADKIEKLCSNILYYIIKTNTAWALYPVLLAVLFRSGCDVGDLNHSTYSCEVLCDLIDKELKSETVHWFMEQESVTLTADIGTILGLSMLVVLLESEIDKTVKFAGINLVCSKEGKYLANQILDVLTSAQHLNLSEAEVRRRVSGMAGDGAFCKDNEPFKSQLRILFRENFLFRWDLLHLVNRAHIKAVEDEGSKVHQLLDFIQNHSSQMRSGLDYTRMVIENVIGFKRPKLKSNTRMVNYEYEQVLRFLENAKYFDHPFHIVNSAKYFVLLAYVTKMILQIAQSTTVTVEFVDSIFYNAGGESVMRKVMEMSSQMIQGEDVDDVVTRFKPQQPDLTVDSEDEDNTQKKHKHMS